MNLSQGTHSPQLSIVIPVFEFHAALPMIRRFVPDIPSIEIVVGVIDGTPEDLTKIKKILNFINLDLQFYLLQSSTPAAINWNQLLSFSTGKYLSLFHHDEYPSSGYIVELLSLTQKRLDIAAFIAPCTLVNLDHTFRRTHSTWRLLAFLIRLDGFILKRNYIGPSACLTFKNDKRAKLTQFDPALQWYVDSEFYLRQLKACGDSVLIVKHGEIRSIQRRSGTLTSRLKSDLKNIKLNETSYMREKYNDRIFWLREPSLYRNFIFLIEFFLYGSLRFFLLIIDLFKKL